MNVPDVVYVDDEELNRILMQKIVGTSFEMEVLSSAQELYELLEKFVPKVLLLDYSMPDISGFEVLKKLRSDERFNDLIIIMFTARASKKDMVTCIEAGANDYVVKPPHYPELVARIHNLMRQKRTQEHMRLENQMQIYETFLAGMTHEFNNIFSAFKLSLQLYEMKGAQAFEPRIADLKEFANRGTGLVKQLRDVGFARKSAYEQLDLISLMMQTVAEFRKDNDLMDIQIDLANDQASQFMIRGNSQQLNQVIKNLMSNARHAILSKGRSGSINLKISSYDQAQTIRLIVEDDGAGIRPEKLRELGNLFYTTKGVLGSEVFDAKTTGTGLGLSTCRRILMAHDAEMDIESIYGQGTRISIDFPMVS